MNKTLLKIIFFWQKPKIVVVTGSGNLELTKRFISRILPDSFLLEKRILLTEFWDENCSKNKKHLILNYDDENARKIKKESPIKVLTFGFWAGADLKASDVNINGGINFKINYQGNIVPVWLENLIGKDQIYAALAAAAVGCALGLNLVEISEALKKHSPAIDKNR